MLTTDLIQGYFMQVSCFLMNFSITKNINPCFYKTFQDILSEHNGPKCLKIYIFSLIKCNKSQIFIPLCHIKGIKKQNVYLLAFCLVFFSSAFSNPRSVHETQPQMHWRGN